MNSPPSPNDELDKPWSRRRQEVGAIVWSSFLAASLATMICFGFLDPLTIGPDDHRPEWLTSRMAGYAAGFFFFWIVTTVASLLTAYLLETSPDIHSTTNKTPGDPRTNNESKS
jgi:hypothetical protein